MPLARWIACTVLVCSLNTSTFAQSLHESVSKLAAPPVPIQGTRSGNDGSGLIWGGLALLGTGLTMEILSFTAAKSRDSACVIDRFGYFCVEETRTNRGLLIGGAVIGATGGVLMNFGFDQRRRARPELILRPQGAILRSHVAW